MGHDVAAQYEKRCAHAFAPQRRQHPVGGAGPGAVVEGQHKFLVGKRQSVREMLAANPWRGAGVDRDHTFGAERVWMAGAGRSHSGLRNEARGQQQDDSSNEHDGLPPAAIVAATSRPRKDLPAQRTGSRYSAVRGV